MKNTAYHRQLEEQPLVLVLTDDLTENNDHFEETVENRLESWKRRVQQEAKLSWLAKALEEEFHMPSQIQKNNGIPVNIEPIFKRINELFLFLSLSFRRFIFHSC